VWRMLVGCGDGEGTCEFKSADFVNWTYVGAFHSHGGGMWECPDFYRLPKTDAYVLKASASGDWWTVGKYDEVTDIAKPDTFTPLSGNDIHDGNQKYDFGTFYASKVFYDTPKDRVVLFGWVNYGCPGTDWTGIQTFPRVVELDPANATRIVTNPLPEIAALYKTRQGGATVTHNSVTLEPGDSASLGRGTQLDVTLQVALHAASAPARTGGTARAIALTVRVLGAADGTSGKDVTVSAGASAGASAGTLDGTPFAIAPDEAMLRLRLLVDHSVVEAYAQGGRAVATHPFCPPSANDDQLTVTNHGTVAVTVDATLAEVQTANVLPTSTVM